VESYGFRGEALSSLCAVSELRILTKTKSDLGTVRYSFAVHITYPYGMVPYCTDAVIPHTYLLSESSVAYQQLSLMSRLNLLLTAATSEIVKFFLGGGGEGIFVPTYTIGVIIGNTLPVLL